MKRLQLGLCLPRIQSHLIIDETVASGIQLSKGEPEGFGCVKITFTWLCTLLITPPPVVCGPFSILPLPALCSVSDDWSPFCSPWNYAILWKDSAHSFPPEDKHWLIPNGSREHLYL